LREVLMETQRDSSRHGCDASDDRWLRLVVPLKRKHKEKLFQKLTSVPVSLTMLK
jgi:hypothetical protein